MLYTINMPNKMWLALRERDAMDNAGDDQIALAVFKEAEAQPVGRGHVRVITGEKWIVDHILDYLHSLLGLAVDRIVPAYEFGTDIQTLRRVVDQEPTPVP